MSERRNVSVACRSDQSEARLFLVDMFGTDAFECRNMMPHTSQIENNSKNLLLPARFLSEFLRTALEFDACGDEPASFINEKQRMPHRN